MHKKVALKRSFWASLGRLLGVILGASAGSMFKEAIGKEVNGYSLGIILAVLSFGMIWFAEFERELSE